MLDWGGTGRPVVLLARRETRLRRVATARVVRLEHADHYVFRSNEADVLREMDVFIAGLK